MGRHTVGITSERGSEPALRWRAVWESGSGVVLDGVTSLQSAGLTGWSEDRIHVSVPGNSRVHEVEGVHAHRLRDVGDVLTAGTPRARPEVAVIRAALWAGTDRQAATLLAMTVQQRLVHPDRVLDVWSRVQRCRRRALLSQVVADVCTGAHSLDELDFAAMCQARGLPEPTRQVVRRGRRGRVYLDVGWEDLGVHVEIDGAQHTQGLNAIDDALRHNDLAVEGSVNLRIPVLGLRLRPDDFMGQVLAALDAARVRRTS
jgi:very-short-patch-repair endonuclease